MIRTATTGTNGSYEFWLPDYGSPYTVLVTEADHLQASASGIVVVGLGTTTQDLSLRWAQPCVAETPPVLSATVAWQGSSDPGDDPEQHRGSGYAVQDNRDVWHLHPDGYQR